MPVPTFPAHVRSIDIARAYLAARTHPLFEWRSSIYAWDGTVWVEWSTSDLLRSVTAFLETCQTQSIVRNQVVVEPLSFTDQKVQDVATMVRRVSFRDDITAAPFHLTNPTLSLTHSIAFRDQILDTATWNLTPRTVDHFFLRVLPFTVDQASSCDTPLWTACLNQWFSSDPLAIECLRRRMGYFLVPKCDYARAFFDVGKPRAGKGVVGEIEEALLGRDHVAARTLEHLVSSHGMEGLDTARLLVLEELDRGGSRSSNTAFGATIKRLLGESTISVNPKGKPMYRASPAFKIKLVGNTTPAIDDTLGSFWRKVIFLAYPNSWLDREDESLTERLKLELPGIAWWAAGGAHSLLKAPAGQRWPVSAASREAYQKAVAATNPIETWLHERCERGPAYVIETKMAYNDYEAWAKSLEVPVKSAREFAVALQASSWAPDRVQTSTIDDGHKINITKYRGLRLRPPLTPA